MEVDDSGQVGDMIDLRGITITILVLLELLSSFILVSVCKNRIDFQKIYSGDQAFLSVKPFGQTLRRCLIASNVYNWVAICINRKCEGTVRRGISNVIKR